MLLAQAPQLCLAVGHDVLHNGIWILVCIPGLHLLHQVLFSLVYSAVFSCDGVIADAARRGGIIRYCCRYQRTCITCWYRTLVRAVSTQSRCLVYVSAWYSSENVFVFAGVPMTEKLCLSRRKTYRAYQKRTPVFFPDSRAVHVQPETGTETHRHDTTETVVPAPPTSPEAPAENAVYGA